MASDVVFVPDPASWTHEFRSWTGVVGRDMMRRTKELQTLSRASAPFPGRRPRNRTMINYATGELAASIISTRARWGPELEGRVIALPKQGLFVHEGTVPHVIVPRKAGGLLRFFSYRYGRVVYRRRVWHPGTRRNPFMAEHLRTVAKM